MITKKVFTCMIIGLHGREKDPSFLRTSYMYKAENGLPYARDAPPSGP